MEKIIVFIFSALIFFSPMFSGTGNNEGIGDAEVLLQSAGFPICLSFEHYKMQDGWTPVVLSLGELNCLLWMDESGRVLELRETGAPFVEPVCVIDVMNKSLRREADVLHFDVYEQNKVRTRWRLSPDKTAGTVAKKISFREKSGVELGLGTLRLQLKYVSWDLKEFSPGLFHVQFHGPMMAGHRPLVYEKAAGMIYSTHQWNNKLTLEQSRTQTVKPAAAAIPPQERAALIALYNSTGGDHWFESGSWKSGPLASDGFALPGTENNWEGITCDPYIPTVTLITLAHYGLNGTLPPELGNLANLLSLRLWANQLSGSIPPELGNLTNLQELLLHANQLSGNIPPELGNLANLQFLIFDWNQLSGSIPPELGNLANLQFLDLGDNQFSGSIPPELGNLTNLQELLLHANQLSGNIPPELANLAYLQGLGFFSNQLSGSIPPELGTLANLQWLSLGANQLSGIIPSELANLTNLKKLWLNENQISSGIPPELGNLVDLEELFLEGNQLSGSIPTELGNLAKLISLKLNSNQISGSIPSELGNLANLQYLWLNSNQLSGSIPSNLTNLTKLLNYHSDIRWNALYTNENILRSFLYSKQIGGYWENTQTIAPSNVTATSVSTTSIDINWTPIAYKYNAGGYRVFYSTSPGGPYIYFGITADKSASSLTITGLNPSPIYYFVVQTRTDPHGDNRNTVDSEYSAEVSASTVSLIISGIVNSGGKALPGVTITLSNGGGTATTDANGNYSVKVDYGWSGTATPSKAGYNFSPVNMSYTNVTVNQTNQNYIASLQTRTIVGKITRGGIGLPGVTITLSNCGGTATTDANGNYGLTVNYGWSGAATPSKAGNDFSPANRSYTNVTVNQNNQNYTVQNITIAGTVTSGGIGLPGVSITFYDDCDPILTDANGYYIITVHYGWTGTATPFKTEYNFSPANRSYTNVTINQTNQNYTALLQTITIAGTVTSGGIGLPGVNIALSNGGGAGTTDTNGNYGLTVNYGWSGTATPSKAGNDFSPANRSYFNVTINQTNQNYTALLQTRTIAGTVTSGGIGLPGVSITHSNGGGTATTDANGNYELTVPYGWFGTTTPSKAGYNFSPVNRSYSNVTVNQTNQDFLGNLITNLTLTSPNGGESWGLNTIRNIAWSSSGLSGNIRLELWKANKKLGAIAANIPISNGHYAWFVGNCGPEVAPTGNDYKVKIITANVLYNDSSNAAFSIVRPSLTLTAPRGGTNWKLGTTQNITWTSAGLTGNVKLLLFKGGVQVGVIARGIPITNGTYAWTVGKNSGGMAPVGSNYSVKIRSEDNRFYSSGSGAFTLQ
ncbi:MAG: fibronectin type III domain-containing protein [Candidatus Aminicenantes bacterium]|nr:fibronectin type III domain-containing protein [Candidatus Aminicenantes bacterium]